MTVYAFDPGPHTGIFYPNAHGVFLAETLDFTVPSTVPSHKRLFLWLARHVQKDDTVICESFHFQKDKQDKDFLNYDAGEYVGVIKLFCQMNDIYYVMQAPAVKQQFWNDDKLRRVGLYKVADSKHSRDAARHWLQYDAFSRNNTDWFRMLKKN